VLRVRPWHRYAVLEVAGGRPGMMRRSAPIVGPDIAVVLAMRRTHTTAFHSLEEHAREKTHLLRALRPGGAAVLYADDPLVAGMADGARGTVVRFGAAQEVELRADSVSARWPDRLSFDLHCDGESYRVRTRLVGEHWLPSVLGALAAARAAGVPLDSAVRAVADVEPFRGRLQPVRLPNGATVLRDDYNASIDGANAAFEVLRRARARRRMLVVSDISDFPGNRRRRLRYLGTLAAQITDCVVFVGESAGYGARRAIEAGMRPECVFSFSALEEAAQWLASRAADGDLVLLKGRTTDHVARLYFSQLGPVSCWKAHCPKTMLCDECWEL
jgi:UDP-N-acetylmuramoyl-tripeptide--D-alanyl-D-alanine ligase